MNVNLYFSENIFSSTNLSASSLLSAYVISNSVKIPAIASSNINCVSISIAIFYVVFGIRVSCIFTK
uniref:Uncharacterized protein n=1 Tax=Bostrychia tenella TaxID=324755 RepID=A0A1Z1M587_9FLOR|nr:hypothetical protein [Bostrychia tenella]ARW61199.1 hypothetical protein [Bostrychia tenella]